MSRISQKYIAAEKLYRSSKAHSGECEDDTLRNIMALYCSTNKYKDKGILRTPGPIKSMEAVHYLSKIPKFSMKVGGSSAEPRAVLGKGNGIYGTGGKDVDGEGDRKGLYMGDGGNISMEEPSARHTTGWKRRKHEEKGETGAQRVARSVDKMASALETAGTDKRKAAALGLQLEIMKSTPMPESEKRKMPDILRRDAAALFRATHRIQDVQKPHVAQSVSPTLDVSQPSSTDREWESLPSAPSFVVMGPNSSSFQNFPDEGQGEYPDADTGSGLTR